MANARIDDVTLIQPWDLQTGSAETGYATTGAFYPEWYQLQTTGELIVAGLAILVVGAWWLMSGRAGRSLQSLAFPIATATASPLLLLPLFGSGRPSDMVLGGLLTVAAMLPLAIGLIDRIETEIDRRFAVLGTELFTIVAVAMALVFVYDLGFRLSFGGLRWFSAACIPLVPGLLAAGPLIGRARAAGGGAGRLLQSAELGVAGATPAFTLMVDRTSTLLLFAGWLVAVTFASRFTVRPLARLATRATLQRDLVVAAAEAERARLAADIHDDALQELTLLVRRLEASGDTEGAEIGRTVADRLRAICGDLRLPILDDLGVGPALDWLVLRIERLAGGEVRLERADDARHSPDVELAIFRVAQEALANAVKHGRPPIVVRYRSTPAGISLAVDDAGPGIADDAPETAEQTGRFGLLNMAQRAEQIGAILDVRRWPGGGTHVALEWRPR
jgi:signal transduction histidine kinase